MYNNYEKALVVLDLLNLYFKKNIRLFLDCNVKIQIFASKLELDNSDTMKTLKAYVDQAKESQDKYNTIKYLMITIRKTYDDLKRRAIFSRNKPFALSKGECALQEIFDSEQFTAIINQIAYDYFQKGKFIDFIEEGEEPCKIKIGMQINELLTSGTIDKNTAITYDVLLSALISSEQFREHNKTKVNKIQK